MFITGRTSDGNRVFFTRFVIETTRFGDPFTISAKRNHAAIPAVNQTTKGTSLVGLTRNPTLKINQKTKIMTKGWIKDQIQPRKDPAYFALRSRLAIESIRALWISICFKMNSSFTSSVIRCSFN